MKTFGFYRDHRAGEPNCRRARPPATAPDRGGAVFEERPEALAELPWACLSAADYWDMRSSTPWPCGRF